MARATNVRWLIFALGCGTSWMLYLHRYTFALIKPSLQDELHLDNTQLGLLDSAFSLSYLVFQIPLGICADVFGAHFFLGGAILLWSVALGWHAWAPSLAVLWVARSAFGLGQAGVYAALSRVTRSWFPQDIRTTLQGWIGVFFGRIGGASANLLFATVLVGWLLFSWRDAVTIFTAAGIVLGIVFLLLYRDSPRRHPLANQAEADLIEGKDAGSLPTATTAPRPSARQMFRSMNVRGGLNLLFLNAQSILSTIADFVYSSWIPLFLTQQYRMPSTELGVYSALPLIGGALGGAVGGYLNDRLRRETGNRRWSRSGVGLAGKGLAGVLLLFSVEVFFDQPYLFCVLLFFVKFFTDWSLASLWGTVTDIGGRASATVFAFNNTVATIGQIIAGALFGYVSGAYGWQPVFIIVAITYLACAASWLLIDCTIPLVAERRADEAIRRLRSGL
jgi:ACS family glucarate transporter-like MFS transporter